MYNLIIFYPRTIVSLLLLVGGVGAFLAFGLVGRPEGEIITQQLHNERRVLVGFFVERVEFGDGVVKGLLGDLTGLVGGVEDLCGN